jgi:hypothetical protein
MARQLKLKLGLDRYREAADEMDDRVAAYCKETGRPGYVDFSAYKFIDDDHDMLVDNMDEVPIPGKVRFRAYADEFFGGDKSRDYESAVVESPTWLQICGLADDMIHTVWDRHHCFLEGVEVVGEEDGVKIAEFSMGS